MAGAPNGLEFEAVYGRHAALVRRTLARRGVRTADLDDVTQELFVAIHRMLPGFEGRSSVETWLHAVAWRVAAHYHRGRRARPDFIECADEVPPPQAEPALAADERLHRALDRIDADQRDLLALHEVGGLSIAELSAMTGNARATVRERLARARSALGRRMIAGSSRDAVRPARSARARLVAASARVTAPARVTDGCRLCRVGDTVFGIWRGAATTAALESLAELLFQAAREQPAGVRYLSVVEAGCAPPPRAGRDVIVEIAATLGPALKATAWAIESSGTRALVPPIINACVFLSRAPLNMRFFADVPAATAWLARFSAASDGASLAAHAERLRAHGDSPPARLATRGSLAVAEVER